MFESSFAKYLCLATANMAATEGNAELTAKTLSFGLFAGSPLGDQTNLRKVLFSRRGQLLFLG
jgi:hypothetical protein